MDMQSDKNCQSCTKHTNTPTIARQPRTLIHQAVHCQANHQWHQRVQQTANGQSIILLRLRREHWVHTRTTDRCQRGGYELACRTHSLTLATTLPAAALATDGSRHILNNCADKTRGQSYIHSALTLLAVRRTFQACTPRLATAGHTTNRLASLNHR